MPNVRAGIPVFSFLRNRKEREDERSHLDFYQELLEREREIKGRGSLTQAELEALGPAPTTDALEKGLNLVKEQTTGGGFFETLGGSSKRGRRNTQRLELLTTAVYGSSQGGRTKRLKQLVTAVEARGMQPDMVKATLNLSSDLAIGQFEQYLTSQIANQGKVSGARRADAQEIENIKLVKKSLFLQEQALKGEEVDTTALNAMEATHRRILKQRQDEVADRINRQRTISLNFEEAVANTNIFDPKKNGIVSYLTPSGIGGIGMGPMIGMMQKKDANDEESAVKALDDIISESKGLQGTVTDEQKERFVDRYMRFHKLIMKTTAGKAFDYFVEMVNLENEAQALAGLSLEQDKVLTQLYINRFSKKEGFTPLPTGSFLDLQVINRLAPDILEKMRQGTQEEKEADAMETLRKNANPTDEDREVKEQPIEVINEGILATINSLRKEALASGEIQSPINAMNPFSVDEQKKFEVQEDLLRRFADSPLAERLVKDDDAEELVFVLGAIANSFGQIGEEEVEFIRRGFDILGMTLEEEFLEGITDEGGGNFGTFSSTFEGLQLPENDLQVGVNAMIQRAFSDTTPIEE